MCPIKPHIEHEIVMPRNRRKCVKNDFFAGKLVKKIYHRVLTS